MSEIKNWYPFIIQMQGMVAQKDIPEPVFLEYQKTFGGTSLEVVPININRHGLISVFLVPRPPADRYWPNNLSVPGTMVFPWDADKDNKDGFKKAWKRLCKKEFMKDIKPENTMHVSTLHLNTLRGAETAYVNVAMVPKNLKGGEWFFVDQLPVTKIIDHHLKIIKDGVLSVAGSVMQERLQRPRFGNIRIANMMGQMTAFKI